MTDDKMPPLPTPWIYVADREDNSVAVFRAFQLRDYARAYAAEQVRELVEALEGLLAWGTDENYVNAKVECDNARALIAKHKGTT